MRTGDGRRSTSAMAVNLSEATGAQRSHNASICAATRPTETASAIRTVLSKFHNRPEMVRFDDPTNTTRRSTMNTFAWT